MKVKIVTALFDISRHDRGDGRSINKYLEWIRETLKVQCDFVIFTEEKFFDFIKNCRDNSKYETNIILQNLEEIPFYKYKESIIDILNDDNYKSKINDPNRIECYLPEYNIIQYSKFSWVKIASEMFTDTDYFFWMDAGCSRFFETLNLNKEWPNKDLLLHDKLQIQGNINFQKFPEIREDEYIWDNNSMLVGTLFGMHRDIINFVLESITEIFIEMIEQRCVNNEQIALAIFTKRFPNKISIFLYIDYTHLPFLRYLGT